MIPINRFISISEDEISESFVRASGPGGQNVNKVSTAVMLRFDVAASNNLPPSVKSRLAHLAGQRMTKDGVLVLTAQEFASQLRNREAALATLVDLIRQATVVPKARRATKPTYGSQLRRLDEKKNRSKITRDRGRPED